MKQGSLKEPQVTSFRDKVKDVLPTKEEAVPRTT